MALHDGVGVAPAPAGAAGGVDDGGAAEHQDGRQAAQRHFGTARARATSVAATRPAPTIWMSPLSDGATAITAPAPAVAASAGTGVRRHPTSSVTLIVTIAASVEISAASCSQAPAEPPGPW